MKILKNSLKITLLLFILISCNDNVPLKRSDLNKYPWLVPFLVGIDATEVKGSHNIDIGTFKFSCELSEERYVNTLLIIDSIAKAENWKIIKKEEHKREYLKVISDEIKDGGYVSMKVEIDSIRDWLFFDIGNVIELR